MHVYHKQDTRKVLLTVSVGMGFGRVRAEVYSEDGPPEDMLLCRLESIRKCILVPAGMRMLPAQPSRRATTKKNNK